VGADAVSPAGLINKTGTLALALAARAFGKPLYALCASTKLVGMGWEPPEEPPRDPAEIADVSIPNLGVRNRYFERTPLELVTAVVTEDGVRSPDDLCSGFGQTPVHPSLRAILRL
jgi:translation initiation factor 2B subunit (eIF-2B alpha/beta/delta family)